MESPSGRWVSQHQCARVFGCSQKSVPKVAAAARIRMRQLPGMHPRYNLEDVLRVAREAELPAAQTTAV
jgi:hypothetical protein